MNADQRRILKQLIDKAVRERAERYYMDCDPETISTRASEAEDLGYQEVADALRRFRDHVVNPLLGEGWTIARIEEAAERFFKK